MGETAIVEKIPPRVASDFSKLGREMKEKMMTKTTQITIETHSITIIRAGGKQHSAHCECCGKTVTAFAPEQIADVLRLNLTEICRQIETKQIHLTNSGEDVAMICGNSFKNNGF